MILHCTTKLNPKLNPISVCLCASSHKCVLIDGVEPGARMHPPGRSRSLRACAVLPGRVKLNPKLKPIVEGSSRFQNIAIISGITNMVKATHQYDVTSVPRRQAIYIGQNRYIIFGIFQVCVFFAIFSAHFLYFLCV